MDELADLWQIYTEAFPECERRNFKQQQEVLKNPNYQVKPVYKDNALVGFYAYWNLDSFIFLEHFAINRKYRGRGYGSRVIKGLTKKTSRRIILEVERPETPSAEKRIRFYQRMGFKLHPYRYHQPPYQPKQPVVPLLLMSYPTELGPTDFIQVTRKLYQEVYHVN